MLRAQRAQELGVREAVRVPQPGELEGVMVHCHAPPLITTGVSAFRTGEKPSTTTGRPWLVDSRTRCR